MGLRLRGEFWYLRKNVGGARKEIALGIGGGEAGRKAAEKAAGKLAGQLQDAHLGAKALRSFGVVLPAPKADMPTFAEWCETYDKTYTSLKAADTQVRDRGIVASWLPILGAAKLDAIKQADCLRGLATRRKAKTNNQHWKTNTTLSEGTVQRERRLIRAIFQRAVENELIERNPWTGVKGKADVARNRLLSEAGEIKMLTAMGSIDARYSRLVKFLLQTGLRINECLDGMVDNGQFVQVVGKFSKMRDVPITKVARQLLDDQVKADGALWSMSQQRVWEVMRDASESVGIGRISPHDLRHTFGHRWIQKGGDIYVLSKILGHASVAVTEKHYAYLLKEDLGTKMRAVMEGVA